LLDAKKKTSDNDGERPVRRKLRETKITPDLNAPAEEDSGNSSDDSSDRGRLQKKRSFEDLRAENQDGASTLKDESGHRRKRSRDSKDDDALPTRGHRDSTPPAPSRSDEEGPKQILSPKKKRSIDQLEKDDAKAEDLAGQEGVNKAVREVSGDKTRAPEERETKRHRDASQERNTSSEGDTVSAKVCISSMDVSRLC
jgi:Ran-binding protein 3